MLTVSRSKSGPWVRRHVRNSLVRRCTHQIAGLRLFHALGERFPVVIEEGVNGLDHVLVGGLLAAEVRMDRVRADVDIAALILCVGQKREEFNAIRIVLETPVNPWSSLFFPSTGSMVVKAMLLSVET